MRLGISNVESDVVFCEQHTAAQRTAERETHRISLQRILGPDRELISLFRGSYRGNEGFVIAVRLTKAAGGGRDQPAERVVGEGKEAPGRAQSVSKRVALRKWAREAFCRMENEVVGRREVDGLQCGSFWG